LQRDEPARLLASQLDAQASPHWRGLAATRPRPIWRRTTVAPGIRGATSWPDT
jgi:hypothetical protein